MARRFFIKEAGRLTLAAAAFASSFAGAKAARAATDASVFVLAVEESESFERGLPTLRFAAADAERFAAVMKATGTVPADHVMTVKEPTLAALRQSFAAVDAKIESVRRGGGAKGARFIFYYTGHSDASGLHLADGLLRKDELHALIAAVRAETKIVFFDACYSGALAAKGVKPATDFIVPKAELDEPSGSVYFAATSGTDVAFEVEELGGSLFTHHLVIGLYGAADVNKDGIVTVDELYQYVYRQMSSAALALPHAEAQKPEYRFELQGRGALVMAYIAQTTSLVSIAPDLIGELTFTAEDGLQTFRLEKSERRVMSTRLVPGVYGVTLKTRDQSGRGTLRVVAGRESRVDGTQLTMAAATDLNVVAKGARTDARVVIGLGASNSSYAKLGPAFEAGFATPAERIETTEWRLLVLAGIRKNELFYKRSVGDQSGMAEAASLLLGTRGAFFPGRFGFAGQEWQVLLGGGADYVWQHWDPGTALRTFEPLVPKVLIGFGTSLTLASGNSLGLALRREFPFAKSTQSGDVLAFGASVFAMTFEW